MQARGRPRDYAHLGFVKECLASDEVPKRHLPLACAFVPVRRLNGGTKTGDGVDARQAGDVLSILEAVVARRHKPAPLRPWRPAECVSMAGHIAAHARVATEAPGAAHAVETLVDLRECGAERVGAGMGAGKHAPGAECWGPGPVSGAQGASRPAQRRRR